MLQILRVDEWTSVSPQVSVFRADNEIGGVDCSVVAKRWLRTLNVNFHLLLDL